MKLINKDMAVKKKLERGFSIPLVSMGVIAVIMLVSLFIITGAYRKALDDYGFSQGDLGKLGITFQKEGLLARDLAMAEAGEDGALAEKLSENRESFTQILENARRFIHVKEVTDALDTISEQYGQYRQTVDAALSLAGEGKKQEALTMLQTEAGSLDEAIEEELGRSLDFTLEKGKQIAGYINMAKLFLLFFIAVITILAIIAGLGTAREISGQINEPIQKIVGAADQISRGNLEVELGGEESGDELGQLSRAFHEMIRNFKRYIREIKRITGSLAGKNLDVSIEEEFYGEFTEIKNSLNSTVEALDEAFRQIISAAGVVEERSRLSAEQAKNLQNTTTEQAGVIEELVATLSLVTENVNQNARDAKKAEELSEETSKIVAMGNGNMEAMVAAIQLINECTGKIQTIIQTIQDIASQTNMLSLNASIEAARAGEAGHGFAVVADEIGKLAAESGQAAKSIIKLIRECLEASENGVHIVNETAASLNKIVEGADQARTLVVQIAAACVQQAVSLEEASKGIDEIAEAMQVNTSLSGEEAETAEELLLQSGQLKYLIGAFALHEKE